MVITGSLHQKQSIKSYLKGGKVALRVVGNEKTGFRLAGERKDAKIIPIGQTFNKQKEAIDFGLRKYKAKAVKFVVRLAA